MINQMFFSLKLLLCSSLFLFTTCKANQQGEYLHKLIQSRRSHHHNKPSHIGVDQESYNSINSELEEEEEGLNNNICNNDRYYYYGDDKLVKGLPGEPNGVDFDQYAGYVTVDAKAGRALFYYFVESPHNSSTNPLVLWLNGGPGCSSLGYGAMEELGPFRVNNDGTTLHRNHYAWNNVANVIFLESPAGVGFSYSNTSSDYTNVGDKSTALDTYTFLVKWLQRFPHYKTRDFYITGESYAGHYVPQLADTILSNNKLLRNHTVAINLKGIAVGNGWIDDSYCTKGMYDYLWTHGLNSDQTHSNIAKYCEFDSGYFSNECNEYISIADDEVGNINIYNIYSSPCPHHTKTGTATPDTNSGSNFDPCSDDYTKSYLNLPQVQKALHAKPSKWYACSTVGWMDSAATILPTINRLISSGSISIWIYSGDTDGRVPITSSRLSINAMKLPLQTAWRPWYSGNEVGGYVVGYKGLTLITVRGAGHTVPSYQPQRALTMISSFLRGKLPPQN